PCVHHQPRLLPVHGTVDVKIEPLADVDRDAPESAEIEAGHGAGHAWIDFQNENLFLAIEERLGGKQNVGAEDAVDLVALARTPEAAEVDENHRLIDEVQGAEAKIARDGDGVERAVDAGPRGDLRFAGDRREPEI